MKVLTLHQPWASLIACGIKTIETRSWSTKYRGPLAIHAAKNESALHYLGWLEEHQGESEPALEPFADRIVMVHSHRRGVIKARHDLPIGAIVATATLVDVAPIVGAEHQAAETDERYVIDIAEGGSLYYRQARGVYRRANDQRPYGDFTPGRYAWILTDVVPVDPPVPFRGGQRLSRSWDPS